MANQILLTMAALAVGVVTIRLTVWPFSFAVGTLLATVNLWWVARGAMWSVRQQFSAALVVVYFGAFLLRFAGTGGIVHLFLVPLRYPVIPLLAGLSSVVVCLSIMGISRSAGNSCKEA